MPKPAPLHKDRHDDEDDERKKDEKPPRVDIDFEGIAGRILGFPVDEGHYEQVVAARNRALFTKFAGARASSRGRYAGTTTTRAGTLLAYDFEQQRMAPSRRTSATSGIGADHRTLVYTSHDRMRAIDALGELPEEGQEDPKLSNEPGPPQRLARSLARERR